MDKMRNAGHSTFSHHTLHTFDPNYSPSKVCAHVEPIMTSPHDRNDELQSSTEKKNSAIYFLSNLRHGISIWDGKPEQDNFKDTTWRAPSWSIVPDEIKAKFIGGRLLRSSGSVSSNTKGSSTDGSIKSQTTNKKQTFTGLDGGSSLTQSTELDFHVEVDLMQSIKKSDRDIDKEAKVLGTLLRPQTNDFFRERERQKTINLTHDDASPQSKSTFIDKLPSFLKPRLTRRNYSDTSDDSDGKSKKRFSCFGHIPLPNRRSFKAKEDAFGTEDEYDELEEIPTVIHKPLPFPEFTYNPQKALEKPKATVTFDTPKTDMSNTDSSEHSSSIRKSVVIKDKPNLRLLSLPTPPLQHKNARGYLYLNSPDSESNHSASTISPCFLAGEASRMDTPSAVPSLPESFASSTANSSLNRSSSAFSYFDIKKRSQTFPMKSNRSNTSPELFIPSPRASPKDLTGLALVDFTPPGDYDTKFDDELSFQGTLFRPPGFTRQAKPIDDAFPTKKSTVQMYGYSSPLHLSRIRTQASITDSPEGINTELREKILRRGSVPEGHDFTQPRNSVRSSLASTKDQLASRSVEDINLFNESSKMLRILNNNGHRRNSAINRGAMYSLAVNNIVGIHKEAGSPTRSQQNTLLSQSEHLVPWRGVLVTNEEFTALNMLVPPKVSHQTEAAADEPVPSKPTSVTKTTFLDVEKSDTKPPSFTYSKISEDTEDSISSLETNALYAKFCEEVDGKTSKSPWKPKPATTGPATSAICLPSSVLRQKPSANFITTQGMFNDEFSILESRQDDNNDDLWKSVTMLYNHVLHPRVTKDENRRESLNTYRRNLNRAPSLPLISRTTDIDFVTLLPSTFSNRSKSDGIIDSKHLPRRQTRRDSIFSSISRMMSPRLNSWTTTRKSSKSVKETIPAAPLPRPPGEVPNFLPNQSMYSLRAYLAQPLGHVSSNSSSYDMNNPDFSYSAERMTIIPPLIIDADRWTHDTVD